MAARQPNESSPLLPSRAAAATTTDSDPGVVQKLQRARYVLIPLLVVAIIGILWASSSSADDDSNDNHHDASSSSPSTPSSLRKPHDDSEGAPAYSDTELLTLAPPFVVKGHPIPPKMINRSAFAGRAIPTNAFWTNLLIGDDHGLNVGAGPVTLSPYTVRCLPKRLDISYGDTRRVTTNTSVTEYFNVDAAFTGYAQKVDKRNHTSNLLGDGNSTSRQVVAFDELSVTVQYLFDPAQEEQEQEQEEQGMKALLVRGSPYVTVEYTKIIPVVEFNATVYSINQVPVENDVKEPIASQARQRWTSKRFEIDIGVYGVTEQGTPKVTRQKWALYFGSERTLQLQIANEKDYRPYNLRGELTTPTSIRLVDTEFYTGAARLAIVPAVGLEGDAMGTLDTHAEVYPVGTKVVTTFHGLTAYVTMQWDAKTLTNGTPSSSSAEDPPLLLLANPHHIDSFSSKSNQKDAAFEIVDPPMGHRTLKSFMTPVIGNTWVLEETLPDVGFHGPQHELDSLKSQPQLLHAIAVALKNDSNYTPEAKDPYYFGKEIGRQARLVLIADVLGSEYDATRDLMLNQLEEWTQPWLVGQNDDQFVYDKDWGGLCSLNGLKGVFWMTDFGNGWYNDHHFHYGYFLYALAVVAKFRPQFAATHKAAMLAITRDIANADPNDPYFPLARHFSWFDGHSFASGVYLLDGGKSQESVSEAINAYYGVYLLGKALQIPQVEHIGHLLVAMESRAARKYWQIPVGSTVYDPLYAKNKMTGQVAATKVSYTTWFGPQVEHIHLINMMPFTPITETFLSQEYIQEEYPVLEKEAFKRQVDPIDDRWKGYAYLDLAIVAPKKAWDLVQQLDFFDDGSSRTNSLFWIATRPAMGEQ